MVDMDETQAAVARVVAILRVDLEQARTEGRDLMAITSDGMALVVRMFELLLERDASVLEFVAEIESSSFAPIGAELRRRLAEHVIFDLVD